MNKCAIFDLDGTLLNTIETITYYCNLTLKHMGFSEIETEKYKYFVGNGARILVEKMLKDGGNYTEENFEKAYQFYIDAYNSDVKYLTEIYPGILELLSGLKNAGYKIAVLSNKPNDAAIETVKQYFGDQFDKVYGAFEDLPKKPDTILLKKLIKELDCDTKNSIYIGDTGVDMQTGKGGGLFTIGVLWGFRKKEELVENGADLICSLPSEILNYLGIKG